MVIRLLSLTNSHLLCLGETMNIFGIELSNKEMITFSIIFIGVYLAVVLAGVSGIIHPNHYDLISLKNIDTSFNLYKLATTLGYNLGLMFITLSVSVIGRRSLVTKWLVWIILLATSAVGWGSIDAGLILTGCINLLIPIHVHGILELTAVILCAGIAARAVEMFKDPNPVSDFTGVYISAVITPFVKILVPIFVIAAIIEYTISLYLIQIIALSC